MNYIERFCRRHPDFGVRDLMKYVAIANVAFWILGAVNPVLAGYLTFDPALVLRGQIWRVITFALCPPSMGVLAFVAIYFYYWIGSILERQWGTPQFNIYFFAGLILTLVYGFLVYFITGTRLVLDAQYVYLSMFFSFAVLFPNMEVLLFFILPIKIKWLALVDARFFIYYIIILPFPFSLLPIVAVLHFVIFCGGTLLGYIAPLRARRYGNTIDFKRAAKRIKREQASQPYRHKCAVCGRTDTEYPELEFRYCSRCVGYHCFCMDHINNHIHFRE
jgi:hypothetical protein